MLADDHNNPQCFQYRYLDFQLEFDLHKMCFDRTPDISKTTHKCDLEQIDPFSEGQKIGFLRFSRHPEVQF